MLIIDALVNCIAYIIAELTRRKINVDEDDVHGAAGGIARLFSEYRYFDLYK